MKGLGKLTPGERLQLLRFVSAAVWADLDVSRSEMSFVLTLARRLGLPDDEVARVGEWLDTPPSPEEVDPAQVPPEHRQLFLEAAREACATDGAVVEHERDSLRLLEELLG